MNPTAVSLPHRIAGNLALDLANTISWRGTAREHDHIADAEQMLAWSVAAGLIDAAADIDPADRAALLAEVHALRDAFQAIGTAVVEDTTPPVAALATVRRLAARTLDGANLRGVPLRFNFAGPDRIVGPLAWSFVDLLRGPTIDRLRQCPPADCLWLFLDETRNGSRRWCEMGTCGNRAKKQRQAR